MTPSPEETAAIERGEWTEMEDLANYCRGVEAERDQLREAVRILEADNRRMHLLYEIIPPEKNAVELMDRYRAALEALASGKVTVTAETHRFVIAALDPTETPADAEIVEKRRRIGYP